MPGRSLPQHVRCLECGYSLHGLPKTRCPECGMPFNPADPETYFDPQNRPAYEDTLSRAISREFRDVPSWRSLAALFLVLTVVAAIGTPLPSFAWMHRWSFAPLIAICAVFDILLMLAASPVPADAPDSTARRRRQRRRKTAYIIGALVLLLLVMYPAGLAARVFLSRGALRQVAEQAAHGQVTRYQWVGLVFVENVHRDPNGVGARLQFAHDADHRYMIQYVPTGPAPHGAVFLIPGWYFIP